MRNNDDTEYLNIITQAGLIATLLKFLENVAGCEKYV